jgi:anhydro-N-acetylmuramic acid kinase
VTPGLEPGAGTATDTAATATTAGGPSGARDVGPGPGGDALLRLLELRRRPSRLVVGLLSGTSADGTDAAVCEIHGCGTSTRVRMLSFVTTPFKRDLRERIFALSDMTALDLCDMDMLLGEAFAEAARAAVLAAGLSLADVHLVGSHGQTAVHRPAAGGRLGGTLQIGEAAVVAERTGLPVVSDFRVRDMAAGGQGAPLVPLVDFLLCRQPGVRRALQNIGGIANVTLVGDALEATIAFDNGPGNMALDTVARAASGGMDAFDAQGARAARGRIDPDLLGELHRHPYLARRPPKSTGRELFGREFALPLLARFGGRLDDLLATLTRFTAEAIARSYRELLPAPPDEVYVSGGGALNVTLMNHLAGLLAPIPTRTTAALGIDPKAKEAIAFAVLANETLFGHPGNIPSATGAAGPRVLGKISL